MKTRAKIKLLLQVSLTFGSYLKNDQKHGTDGRRYVADDET